MNSRRKTVFVAMPFKPQYDSILRVIKDAASMLNAELIHLGEQPFVGSITTKLCNSIDEADALLAIASEENGNVYYEIGLAHCQQKPVAILTSDASKLKFDLRDHRAIVYDPTHPERIRDELIRTLNSVLEAPSDQSSHFAYAFRGVSEDPKVAYEQGLRKAKETVTLQLGLTEPVEVASIHFHQEKRETAFEVRDFMGVRARAVVDINGIIRLIKRVSR